MNAADVAVIVLGTGLIGWELWYFLAPPVRDVAPPGGVQEIRVRVRHGFEPDTIPVEIGRPVRLVFYREETAACSGELVFEGLDIRRSLPPFEATPVEFTPTQPGDYVFRCGPPGPEGRVVAQVGRDAARLNLGRGHDKHA
ncbi:MAG: cupredoxin domain-containing protein [Gemmatimonadota bacterium]|nr:cupredoxin domain-containing protein [Gemmatimonadota bacterium]